MAAARSTRRLISALSTPAMRSPKDMFFSTVMVGYSA
jgi:hypothetical protein